MSEDNKLGNFALSRRNLLKTGTAAVAFGGYALSAVPGAAAATGGAAPGTGPGGAGLPVFPPSQPSLQPGSLQGLQAFLNYDPAKDPNARYVRSQVPLARRIQPLAATQANPAISAAPQLLNMERQYFNLRDGASTSVDTRYGYQDGLQISRNIQYTDITCGWNGSNIVANSGYVDRAHRNGVLALGVIYQPYFYSPGGDSANPDFLTKAADGSFPVGDKLVDLAAYFGYDGYFVNIEGDQENISAARAQDLSQLMVQMKARARKKGMANFYLQIYDALHTDGAAIYDNRVDPNNSGWVTKGAVDSIFVNYAWPINFPQAGYQHPNDDYVAVSMAEAKRVGMDPDQTMYFGMDCQESGDNVHATPIDAFAEQIIPLNGSAAAKASLALFVSTDEFRRLASQVADPATAPFSTYEEAVYSQEQNFWAGPSGNPSVEPAEITGLSAEQMSAPDYVPQYGVANFIAERSVIGSTPFTTRFNLGAGENFVIDGTVARDSAWFNVGVQDILPTWQWWRRPFAAKQAAGSLLEVSYTADRAYNGSHSVLIAGDLGTSSATAVPLFKTNIATTGSTRISVTYREGSKGAADDLYVGVVLAEDIAHGQPELPAIRWAKAAGKPAVSTVHLGGGWVRSEVQIGQLAGPHVHGKATIAALCLGVSPQEGQAAGKPAGHPAAPVPYSINIGGISVYEPKQLVAPSRPERFAADSVSAPAGGTVTIGFSWKLAAADKVWYYDLSMIQGRQTVWIGRTYGDAYLAGDIPAGKAPATFMLTPVNHAGQAGPPVSLSVRTGG